MPGTLKENIRNDFSAGFHDNCIRLIGEACLDLKNKHIVTVDWDEENISANISTAINTSPNALKWQIHVVSEVPLYDKEILQGTKKAKSAKRVDLELGVWNENYLTFSVEAKNLIQNKIIKNGCKKPIYPLTKQKRYIETGIDHYVSGYYPPNGCMLGYVLEGDISSIVSGINKIMKNKFSCTEKLYPQSCQFVGIDGYYVSHHTNLNLDHFFVKF